MRNCYCRLRLSVMAVGEKTSSRGSKVRILNSGSAGDVGLAVLILLHQRNANILGSIYNC